MFGLSHLLAFAAALLLVACQPEIGDSCSNASDCSQQGERTCDVTQPGGYCTIFGCDVDACPEEAACIGFQSVVSIAPECSSLQARPRLQRTLCLLTCKKNSDCRGGYSCVDMKQQNPWGAQVISSGSGKVCALPAPAAPVGETQVCSEAPLPIPVFDAGGSPDAASSADAASSSDAAADADAQ
ncbi:MAG TPA: hypothetical protein VJU61_00210 [Polyangiaceae bacterium]|nr:hypothetical protein [Polyangiaceae bacterium]